MFFKTEFTASMHSLKPVGRISKGRIDFHMELRGDGGLTLSDLRVGLKYRVNMILVGD